MLSALQSVERAEARGDAAAALDVILSRPVERDGRMFWHPDRVRRLGQLTVLGPLLPRWVTSRWILAQAVQVLEPANRSRGRRAVETAVRVRGGPGTLRGLDEYDAMAKVADHDWVHRQLFLYDLGGLDHFLRRVAAPDLLAGADRIEEWATAPMGAYRLVEETPRELTWRDLVSGGELGTINLGAATMTSPGDCVLGRVVPSEEGALFESAPLPVPEGAALDVARDPSGWVDVVERACRDEYPLRGDELCITGDFDFAMLTDVPGLTQHYLHHVAAGTPFEAGHRRCDLAALAADFVRAAVREEPALGDAEVSPWPSVSAALVEPHVSEHLLRDLTPGDAEALLQLGARLPRPAADMCLALGELLREAA